MLYILSWFLLLNHKTGIGIRELNKIKIKIEDNDARV